MRPFPLPICEPVVAGAGRADLLIVSDLPLQGGVRVSATQMAQAIAFVLRERGFRAGRFKVAYQSCDDSIASTGLYDEAKCAANARAYGENPDVLGVDRHVQLAVRSSPRFPELNRAPDGPLAMVSPLNSFVGLTRAGPDVDPSLPAALYPTGVATTSASIPTDDLEGAALALFARNRGRTRVFVLDDGDPGYGALQATTLRDRCAPARTDRRWAARPGIRGRQSYADIARRVAASGAAAVYVGGLLDTNAGADRPRAASARLGNGSICSGPSGLTPVSLLVKSSKSAALRHVPEPRGRRDRATPSGRSSLGEALRRDADAAFAVEPVGRVRGAGDGGAARRDRALGRNASLGGARALRDTRRRTACSGASGSTRTATSPRAR